MGQGQEATSVLGGQRTKQRIPGLVMGCTAARGGSARPKEILSEGCQREKHHKPPKEPVPAVLTCSKALSWLEARA